MNLFLRFFWLWIRTLSLQHVYSDTVRQGFRVWLHDMGWRTHLPNFRFLSFMELGRFQYWQGVRSELRGPTGMRMIAAQDMTYIRPVGFLAKLEMTTCLLTWDNKYIYFRHDFYVGKTLVATGLVKEACVVKGSVKSPSEIFCGQPPQNAAGAVEHWLQMQSALRNQTDRR